jgi:hypothetical protein
MRRNADEHALPGVPLQVVSMGAALEQQRRIARRVWCRAARSCAGYVGHGLQLLGEGFAAGAWAARSETEASVASKR